MADAYIVPPLRTATVAGRTMAWRERGGPVGETPMVLLHGIGSNARAWAGQFAGFGGERRVIAWNAPGYDGSEPLSSPWPEPGDYGRALLDLAGHLGLDRFVLVGQSLGAVMAAAVALQAPERLEALVLTSPARGYGARPGAGLPPGVQARLDDLTLLGPAGLARARSHRLVTDSASDVAREIVRQAMSEVTTEGYAQASRLLAGADLPGMAGSVTVPATVIWGAEDVITPPDGCREIAESLPGATAIELPRGGHAVATEYPSLFNTALRRALSPARDAPEISWT